ncbi:MAG: TlpA family protein disulfide reductase [Chryseobacterium sp.]|nr:MAG: TlpA family protein disulfide reductase [Chryseobacterium sp.]
MIGSRFPIERFKNEEGINYSKASFEGRPTLINFWFTSCVPCVAEIPLLNSMRTTATNRFNFIAITFENKKNVDAFLKNVDFQFTHLTDAKMQLDSLKIFAFPTSVILDKNGVVVDVYGEISKSSKQVSDLLSQLL